VVPVIRFRFAAAFSAAPISIDSLSPPSVRAAHGGRCGSRQLRWGAPDALLDVVAELEMPIVAYAQSKRHAVDGPVVDAVLTYLEDCA